MSKPTNLESYPPLFRPTQELDPDPTQEQGTNTDPLPLIDLECLDVDKLDMACRDWGIFRVVNHGVPTELLRDLKEHAKTLFNMPFEFKQGLSINYFWGTPALSPAGHALHRGASDVDWLEGFHVPLAQLSSCNSQHHDDDQRHGTDDRSLIVAFRKLLEDYRGHLRRIGLILFEGMLRSVKVEQELSRPMFLDESTELVRVYRYPRRNVEHEVENGMHAHTDSSVLSILNEDDVGGLQFLKRDQWFDVNPIPSTLVVNLGDMMQALSNDEYKSVKHRVKVSKHKERVSICYFVFPQENTLIQAPRYKPFTYNEFRAQVQQDLKTIGSKIGLQSFRLPETTSN